MKKLLLLTFLISNIGIHAQVTEKSDELAIKKTLNHFFESLENQDTNLLKKVSFMEGQIWTINNIKNPTSHKMRFFRDDLTSFDPAVALLETPLSFDIKIHNGLAVAWVPYEFRVNGKFSHCGIDVFTLVKKDKSWKIINVSYTLDTLGCDQMKIKN